MLQPIEEGGVGLLSYHLDYTQHNITQATKVLNDQGRLGVVSRSLLECHYNKYTGANKQQAMSNTPIHYRLNTTLRQLQLAKTADVCWVLNGTPYFPVDDTKFQKWHLQWCRSIPDSLNLPQRAMAILWTLGPNRRWRTSGRQQQTEGTTHSGGYTTAT